MLFDIDVRKRLSEVEVACAFRAEHGLTVLFGPSGAGKTSVLNMIAGLLRPDAGHIRAGGRLLYGDGVDVAVEQRRCGYVFQESRLFPHLSVRANLLYGAARGAQIGERLAFLGIDHLLGRRPATLSGGEARRVAIGRALLSDPAFLLLDEPLSGLDRARRDEVLRAIEHLRDAGGLPILMVTHDRADAERLGASIVEV